MWKSVSELLTNFFFSPCQLPPLHMAAREGNLDKVKELVQDKADVNGRHIPSGVSYTSCNN